MPIIVSSSASGVPILIPRRIKEIIICSRSALIEHNFVGTVIATFLLINLNGNSAGRMER